VVAGANRGPAVKATLFGTAAGLLFGLSAALTKATVDRLDAGALAIIGDWHVYALIVAGYVGMTLSQASLQTGRLAPAVATQMIFDPVVSLLLGTVAFQERIHASPAALGGSITALVVMLAGVVVLAAAEQDRESRPAPAASSAAPSAHRSRLTAAGPQSMGETGAAGEESSRARAADFVADERARRIAKLESLRERGIAPYPVRFDRSHSLGEVRARFGDLAPGRETDTALRVAGRVMLIRRHGGLIFADLADQTGKVQLLAARDKLGEQGLADFRALDRGDWLGVAGTVMCSRRGELSIRVGKFQLLGKALRALPDKHQGLTDVERRLRERHLDLIVNPGTPRIFDVRSAAIAAVRRVLVERGFTEVETPVLDAAAGGATAQPFLTHHDALDIELRLRIALELPLKRLVVGGFERVFEMGRVFRNEGLDHLHNPEFTLLEAYQAFVDYYEMMALVETIVSEAAKAAIGTTVIQVNGGPIDLKPPWARATMADLIERRHGVRMHPSMPVHEARAICDRLRVPYESRWGSGRLMSQVYERTCESTLMEPVFVCDHPREVSPLARAHRDDPQMVERFEAVVAGVELANGYSELNDPMEQRARFAAQAVARPAGDEKAEDIDEDYVRALEYGLPPTGGLGIGLDRMVMLIAGAPAIREVLPATA
jgi:lysyl-tRNA synthetase class 2